MNNKLKWKAVTILLPKNAIGGYFNYITDGPDGLDFYSANFDMRSGKDVFNLTGVDLEVYGERSEKN